MKVIKIIKESEWKDGSKIIIKSSRGQIEVKSFSYLPETLKYVNARGIKGEILLNEDDLIYINGLLRSHNHDYLQDKKIDIRKEDTTLVDIAKKHNICYGTLTRRLKKGYTLTKALAKEISPARYEIYGQRKTVKEISNTWNIPLNRLYRGIASGKTIEEIFTKNKPGY